MLRPADINSGETLWSLVFIVFLVLSSDARAANFILGDDIQVSLPDGYEQQAEGLLFVRRGNGKAALASLVPDVQFDSHFLQDWFRDDVVAYLSIRVLRLEDLTSSHDQSATVLQLMDSDKLQQTLVDQLTSRWGKYSFALPIRDHGIWWFVNYVGAFVAVSTRVVGKKLVVIESMDRVHVLVTEKQNVPNQSRTVTDERLWEFFRRAANASDAEAVLLSARSTNR